jgi:hypothetical protein
VAFKGQDLIRTPGEGTVMIVVELRSWRKPS